MAIAPIMNVSFGQPVSNIAFGSSASNGTSASGSSFSNMVSQALQGVGNSLSQADNLASSYAAGGNVTIEQLMLAEQKATLAVDAVTEIQKHVVQSYQAVMNMQV